MYPLSQQPAIFSNQFEILGCKAMHLIFITQMKHRHFSFNNSCNLQVQEEYT